MRMPLLNTRRAMTAPMFTRRSRGKLRHGLRKSALSHARTTGGLCYASPVSSRTWQMLAAAVSVALMIVVLLKYGLRDEAPPTTKPASSQPHAGAQHHTEGSADPIVHQGSQLAPIQVFAKAQVGDWIAYRVTNRSTALAEDVSTIVLATITAATDSGVTVAYKGRMETAGERREQWTYERPRDGLTIDQLTDNDVAQWRLIGIDVTADKHEVGGREFACKQISYAGLDPLFPSKKSRTTLWISDEVPAGGLVEQRDIQDLDTMHMEQIKQLIGFGTATATTWGTKPDGF